MLSSSPGFRLNDAASVKRERNKYARSQFMTVKGVSTTRTASVFPTFYRGQSEGVSDKKSQQSNPYSTDKLLSEDHACSLCNLSLE